MPSATSLLGFPKEDRDFLGGWPAQASDRRRKVINMQRAAVSETPPPFAECMLSNRSNT